MPLTSASPTAYLPALARSLGGPRSAFIATALGWLLPGLGQVYVGRPGRGFAMLVAIGGLFYGGLWLTAFTCVNPQTYSLEFIAHAFLGGPTAVTYALTQNMQQTEPLAWFEVGRLYAAVAGLLNIVAICDAVGEVLTHNERIREQGRLREHLLMERQRELDHMIAAREAAEAQAREQLASVGPDLELTSPDAVDHDPTDPDSTGHDSRTRDSNNDDGTGSWL